MGADEAYELLNAAMRSIASTGEQYLYLGGAAGTPAEAELHYQLRAAAAAVADTGARTARVEYTGPQLTDHAFAPSMLSTGATQDHPAPQQMRWPTVWAERSDELGQVQQRKNRWDF